MIISIAGSLLVFKGIRCPRESSQVKDIARERFVSDAEKCPKEAKSSKVDLREEFSFVLFRPMTTTDPKWIILVRDSIFNPKRSIDQLEEQAFVVAKIHWLPRRRNDERMKERRDCYGEKIRCWLKKIFDNRLKIVFRSLLYEWMKNFTRNQSSLRGVNRNKNPIEQRKEDEEEEEMEEFTWNGSLKILFVELIDVFSERWNDLSLISFSIREVIICILFIF